MPAKEISLKEAKTNKLFYFVANVVVYREKDGRCLIMKRDEREKVHPGRWSVLGGKLEWEDLDLKNPTRMNGDVFDFEDKIDELLQREVKEEANIEIKKGLKYINNVVFVRPDAVPVVLMKFAARYKAGKVVPEKGGFTDFAWVDAKEIKKYACIDGIPAEVSETIKLYS